MTDTPRPRYPFTGTTPITPITLTPPSPDLTSD